MADPLIAMAARRICRAREASGLTQAELAERAGTCNATVCYVEGGRDSRLGTWLALAAALGMSPAELLAVPECPHCDGLPPAGYACAECGRAGR